MKKTMILLMAAVILPICAAASPLNLSQVGADADWVVHADYDHFRNTDFGRLIEARLDELGFSAKLDDFAKAFSFHPLDDVRDVTLYGSGNEQDDAVVVIRGTFDRERLLALLRLNPEYGEEAYADIVLRRWHDDKQGRLMYGCFYSNELVVMSSGENTAKGAVDVLDGKAAAADGSVFGQPSLSDSAAFLKAAARNVAEIADADKHHPVVMKQTDWLSAAVGETGGQFYSDIVLGTKSAEAAESITKMVEGLVALSVLNGEQNSRLSEMAQKVEVTGQDDTVRIRFSAAPESVVAVIAEHAEAGPAK